MLYSYQAYTKEGKKSKGTIEAISEADAKDKIRAFGLILLELKEEKASKSFSQLSKDNLIIFTSQLTQLISAKIPLYESLVALEEQARNESFHAIILSISEKVKSGMSLSKALQNFPKSFSPLYRALISAGEAIGNLELPLQRLTTLLTYQRKMTKQFMSAMAYPIFLMVLMVAIIGVLMGFVIPSLEALFDGRELPWFTAIIFGLSQLVRSYWLGFFLFLGTLFTLAFFHFRKKKTQAKVQRQLLKVPIVKKYIIHSALGRFARTLAALIEGGLPLTNSLAFATESLYNARLEEILTHVSSGVIDGKTISEGLFFHKEIPPLFARMVKIGEESGKLAPMLTQIASIYEEETERTLNKLVTLAQPVLLIIMGSVIGAMILSILLPLSNFGSSLNF